MIKSEQDKKQENQEIRELARAIEQASIKETNISTFLLLNGEPDEPPEIVKEIIGILRKEKGLTYGQAYGILLLTKKYLEVEANYLNPIL